MARSMLAAAVLLAVAGVSACSDEGPSPAAEESPAATVTNESTANESSDSGSTRSKARCEATNDGRSSAAHVYVYFVCGGAPSGVAPVRFDVPAGADPLTFAARKLVDGPTKRMKRHGYWRAEAPGTEVTVTKRGSSFVVDYERSTIDLPILLEAGSLSALPWRKTLGAIDPHATVRFTVDDRGLCSLEGAPC